MTGDRWPAVAAAAEQLAAAAERWNRVAPVSVRARGDALASAARGLLDALGLLWVPAERGAGHSLPRDTGPAGTGTNAPAVAGED